MTKAAADFQAWVDKLVHACLPIELQKKILSLKPLTKDEVLKYAHVVQLVAEAQQLSEHREIIKKLDNISSGIRKSHLNERDILRFVSDEPERYAHKDGRYINDVKSAAVYLACTRITRSPLGDDRAIGAQVFNDFSKAPGFYQDFDSFMRQVRRKLAESRT